MRRPLLFTLALLAMHGIAGAQWVQTSGPEGGFFTAIAGDGDGIVGSVAGSGVVRDADGTWSNVNPLLLSKMIAAPNVVIGTQGINNYRSSDHGVTWTPFDLRGTVSAVGNDLFINNNDTLYHSTDGAVTWTLVGALPSFTGTFVEHKGEIVAIADLFGATLIASTDRGATWHTRASGIPQAGSFIWDMAATNDALYAIPMQHNLVFKSTDKGATWSDISAGIDSSIALNWIHTNATSAWVGGINGAYRLGTNGWEHVAIDPSFGEVISASATNNGLLIGTSARALLVPNNSGSASPIGGSLRNMTIPAMGAIGDVVFASTTVGVARSLDHGASWNYVAPLSVTRFATVGSAIFAIADEQVYRSLDSGITWTALGETILKSSNTFLAFTDITSDQGAVYVTRGLSLNEHGDLVWDAGGVYRSDDLGKTWREISAGLPSTPVSPLPVRAIMAHGNNLVISTDLGIYRSTTRGNNWTPITSLQSKGGAYLALAGSTMYDITTSAIYASTDDGANWKMVPPGYPASLNFAYLAGVVDGKIYITAFERRADGTFPYSTFTYDGSAWSDITKSIPHDLTMLSIERAGNDIYAGADGRSVWRMAAPAGVERAAEANSAAMACFPNPSLGATTLRFTLPEPGHITLTLIDALGNRLATLLDGTLPGGERQQEIDMAGFPPGTYFVRLACGGAVQQCRIVKLQ